MLIELLCLVAAAPTQEVDPPTLRIVTLGDAYTARSRENSRPWPGRLERELLKMVPRARIEVENEATPGSTTGSALRRLRRDVLDRDPDLVVLQFGANDAAVDVPRGEDFPRIAPGAFRSNLVDLVSTLKSARIDVVLVQPAALTWTDDLRATMDEPPFDVDDPWGLDLLVATYAGIVAEVAASERVPIVAVHEADRARGIEATSALRLGGTRGAAEAHAWQAREVTRAILELLADGELRRLSEHRAPSRGWTIPELDLAPETERVIVVDREAGQYLGHPSTVRLRDGSILCAYPKGHGRGAIVMKRSRDGGRTWGERLPVPESWATSKETPTLYRVPTADGSQENVVCWSGLHPARRALSTDGGETWGELEVPAPDRPWGGIVVMGDQARLADGRTAAWFHDDGRFFRERAAPERSFTVFQTTTADGGVTWSHPRPIVRWPHGHLCEPGVIRRGPALALLLRENSRERNSQLVLSRDEGETWSDPLPLSGALTGDRHQVLDLPDGRLFISFRDTGLDSPRYGDWVAWVGTLEDAALGREGQLRLRLMDNHVRADCAYPALELVDDPESGPTIVAVTYGHWTEGESPWIACLRIPVADLPAAVR